MLYEIIGVVVFFIFSCKLNSSPDIFMNTWNELIHIGYRFKLFHSLIRWCSSSKERVIIGAGTIDLWINSSFFFNHFFRMVCLLLFFINKRWNVSQREKNTNNDILVDKKTNAKTLAKQNMYIDDFNKLINKWSFDYKSCKVFQNIKKCRPSEITKISSVFFLAFQTSTLFYAKVEHTCTNMKDKLFA